MNLSNIEKMLKDNPFKDKRKLKTKRMNKYISLLREHSGIIKSMDAREIDKKKSKKIIFRIFGNMEKLYKKLFFKKLDLSQIQKDLL